MTFILQIRVGEFRVQNVILHVVKQKSLLTQKLEEVEL